MSDTILLFLAADIVVLLLLGSFVRVLPHAALGLLIAILNGLGAMLCLPPLLLGLQATAFGVPAGPPGLALHLALDQLSAFFLIIVFLAGTALAASQAALNPPPALVTLRMTAFCGAGAALSLLAADGVTLAIGLAISCAAIGLPHGGNRQKPSEYHSPQRFHAALLVPLCMLAAVCLLTPNGFAPRFDAIRAAPIDADHATFAAALTIAAVAGLSWSNHSRARCGIQDALAASIHIPCGSYLLLRVLADLSGSVIQTGCGFVLLLAGGAVAVVQGWCSARHPDIDGAVAALMRRQAGLAVTGIGLGLIARAADLPGAASFAFAATFLLMIGTSLAGVLTSLAAQAIGARAGTARLSRLGGLAQTMPATSAALAIGLMGLSALPPGMGFASLWLMFESILSAPRTAGLLFQLPLALTAAAVALSAALTTASSVRLVGVALLGRPRTPLSAGATESKSASRNILLVLAGLSVLAGVLPGAALWLLADPAIRILTGVPPGSRVGLTLLLPSIASPSYLAVPVLALLALATVAVRLALRWVHKDGKKAGFWADGMPPPVGLPFGEPAAQSTGEGFLPLLPAIVPPAFPQLAGFLPVRPPSAIAGLWLVLAGFGLLLLVLAVIA